MLGEKLSAVKYRSDIISIYTFATHIQKQYALAGMDSQIGKFLLEFIEMVNNHHSISDDKMHTPYRNYAVLRSSSADSASNIQDRHKIMVSKFLLKFPQISIKGSNTII